MTAKAVDAILTHMNKDHKVSLYDYLAHYSGIKLSIDNPQQSVELVDVKLDKLTLNYNESGTLKSTVIPIDPPMKDYSEARFRFVGMAFKAADALKKSPYRITSFLPITSTHLRISFGAIGLAVLYMVGVRHVPQFAARIESISPALCRLSKKSLIPTLIIHLVEHLFVVFPMLRYHRSPLLVHIQYLLATLFVGFPSWLPLKKKSTALAAQRADFEKKL